MILVRVVQLPLAGKKGEKVKLICSQKGDKRGFTSQGDFV
jgi:hypothetical protein